MLKFGNNVINVNGSWLSNDVSNVVPPVTGNSEPDPYENAEYWICSNCGEDNNTVDNGDTCWNCGEPRT